MRMADLLLSTDDVGKLLGGILPETVTRYLRESKPGGRYGKHPFPPPDGSIQGRYFWLVGRKEEIEEWNRTRPHSGTRTDLRPCCR